MKPKERLEIQQRLNEKANEALRRDALRSRVFKIITKLGYVWTSALWLRFDVVLSVYITNTETRKKVLKRIFSKNCGRILSSDDKWVEYIESYLGMR
jgi:hypothetical protein